MRGMEVLVVRATGVEQFLVLQLPLPTVRATGVEEFLAPLLVSLPTVGVARVQMGTTVEDVPAITKKKYSPNTGERNMCLRSVCLRVEKCSGPFLSKWLNPRFQIPF